jgi:cathepsin D
MAEPGLTPFFDALMNQNLIDRNIFAFYMSMNPLIDDSELTFGSYDTERFEGDLTWHPVINKLFWSLNLEDVRIGN